MHRPILFLFSALFLFTNFSCPQECEEFFFAGGTGGELPIEVETAGRTYTPGDTVVLSANFPANLVSSSGENFLISENGGLVVTDIYRINRDSNSLEPALNRTELIVFNGEFLAPAVDTLNTAVRLRYRCPEGNCFFRQGFRINEPGEYILRVTPGAIDEIIAPFNYCETPRLSTAILVGGNNLPEDGLNYPLETPGWVDSDFRSRTEFVDPSIATDVYYLTVE